MGANVDPRKSGGVYGSVLVRDCITPRVQGPKFNEFSTRIFIAFGP